MKIPLGWTGKEPSLLRHPNECRRSLPVDGVVLVAMSGMQALRHDPTGGGGGVSHGDMSATHF